MRSEKLKYLVHSSLEHKEVISATVRVRFKEIYDYTNPRTQLVELREMPNSKFEISRTVYKRDGHAKYYINGNESTHVEVSGLLSKKGIDLQNNRFLILQGEVESISTMSPKAQNKDEIGLLEYIEDIIGTLHYRDLIQQMEERLKYFDDQKFKHYQEQSFLEKQINLLNDEKENSIKLIYNTQRLYLLQNMDFCVKIYKLQGQCKAEEEELQTLRGHAQKLKQERKDR